MTDCPDCGSDVEFETEQIVDPAATHRMATVTYCPECGEVV